MKAYKKLMNILAKFEGFVMSTILSLVTVITFVNVVVRKLTDGQFAWSEELSINLFVLLIMMGCALSARDGSLISLKLDTSLPRAYSREFTVSGTKGIFSVPDSVVLTDDMDFNHEVGMANYRGNAEAVYEENMQM